MQNLFRQEVKKMLEPGEAGQGVAQAGHPSPLPSTPSSYVTTPPNHHRGKPSSADADSDADTPPTKRVNRSATIMDDEDEDDDYESQSD